MTKYLLFKDTDTTESYTYWHTLSLHDALPILSSNINQIPLGAVQRIEVLRDGASALYGSDAVAGVVNTILRKDYDGAEATIRYGGADDGSVDETSATFLGGKNFNEIGRASVRERVGPYV